MSGQIDRWWGTTGQDESFPVTWTVEVEESGEYSLDIDIENFVTQQWDLSSTARAAIWLKSSSSPSTLIGTREFNFEGTANLGSLEAGTYELEISGFLVPETPVIERVKFQLEKIELDNVVISDSLNALFVADHSDNADLSPDRRQQYEAWIDQYAPILYFDAGITGDTLDDEQFAVPFSVDETWGASGIAKPTGSSKEFFNLSGFLGNYTPNNTNGAIYASILEQGDEVAINYYFHYPRSNWEDYEGFNTHEGDWEGITVFLKGGQPNRVAYAQHVSFAGGGHIVTPSWSGVERDGDRPKVYVGLGGHASYPYPGLSTFPTGNEFHKGDFQIFKPSPDQVHYLPRAGSLSLEDEKAWLLYPGTWGSPDLNGNGITLLEGDGAPRGPIFLDDAINLLPTSRSGAGDRWLDPWTWSTNNVKNPGDEPPGVSSFNKPYWYIGNDFTVGTRRENNGFWSLDAYSSPQSHLTVVGSVGDDDYIITIDSEISPSPRPIYISDRGGWDILEITDAAPFDFDTKLDTSVDIHLSETDNDIDFPVLSKPQQGKMGIERVGTTLVIDFNRDGQAELVQGRYEGANDLAILNFFSGSGSGAGSGFIEEFVRSKYDLSISERSQYYPLMGEEILRFFGG